jgi:hypothetical protein
VYAYKKHEFYIGPGDTKKRNKCQHNNLYILHLMEFIAFLSQPTALHFTTKE